ncbi:MAG: amidohydrolase [Caulobacteraceae bacterium]|nr:amidohydrolase [Caulobacteraceae bacterium]
MRNYEIVSTDSHLEVPPYMWEPYVAKEFREYVPKVVQLPGGGDGWKMPGKMAPVPLGLNFSAGRGWRGLRTSGISYSEHLVGAGDAKQRLREMDEDGVDAELLFPAVSGQRTLDAGAIPNEAYVALAQGYNNWLSKEYTSEDPDRLWGLAILPGATIKDSVAELERVAKLPGVKGVVLHHWPNGGPTPKPDEDDLFWKRIVELGMPLTAHIRFGGGAAAEQTEMAEAAAKGMSLMNFAPMTSMLSKTVTHGAHVIQLIQHGTFDRFPKLQFFFAETQIGWIPEFKEDADENWRRHRYWSKTDSWAHEPSWYVDNHTHWGFQVDRFGLKVRHDIGVDRIQWSTDFPHVQCDWPNSRQIIEDQFRDIPADEKRKIVCDNALKYFKAGKFAAA